MDDDIDAYDINDVLWAMCSRADPVDATEIIRRCWSGLLDPIIPKDRKGVSSRMIIDACRPFEWLQTSRPRGRDRRGVSEEFNGEVEEGTI